MSDDSNTQSTSMVKTLYTAYLNSVADKYLSQLRKELELTVNDNEVNELIKSVLRKTAEEIFPTNPT